MVATGRGFVGIGAASLSSAALQSVAQHALAHVRWRDPLVNAGLRIGCVLWWPSVPL